jgi:hypothetical protein
MILCKCNQCKYVDLSKPSTFGNCCLNGAVEIKDHLERLAAPAEAARKKAIRNANRDPNKASKKKIAEVMRYVA